MTSTKPTYPLVAQAETLLVYGIFLLLTGLAQIGVTLGHRYLIQKTDNIESMSFRTLFPATLNMTDIHLWYIYPSATFTIIPFLCCVTYAIFKRRMMAILICMGSLISFVSSSIYVGLLIVHTIEYWQTASSYRLKSILSSSTTTTTTTSSMHLLVPFDEPVTFANLALLITFTLALVQALLSMIGAVISCLWSPCCISTTVNYTPISTNSHYAQTTPHRHENPPSSTLRSLKRQQQQQQTQQPHHESHRFITTTSTQDSMLNGFLHKSPPLRSHYDEV